MKTIFAVMLLVGMTGSAQAYNRQLDQMTTYADNAILDAAQDGIKAVTLTFGHADPALVEALSDDLRGRGYAIDEETALLNPSMIKVRFLRSSAMAENK